MTEKKETGLQKYNRHAKLIREEYRAAGLYADLVKDQEAFKRLVRESIAREEGESAPAASPPAEPKAEEPAKEENPPESAPTAKEEAEEPPAKKDSPVDKAPPAKKVPVKKKAGKRKRSLKSLGVVGNVTLYKVPVTSISLPEEYPRFDVGPLAQLEKSVEDNVGVADVVDVYISDPGKLVAVNKYRVIKAAKKVASRGTKIEPITVRIIDKPTSVELNLQFLRSNTTKQPNPLEVSGCCQEAATAASETAIAGFVGVTVKRVRDALALLGITKFSQQQLLKNKIDEQTALSIIRDSKDNDDQDAMVRSYIAKQQDAQAGLKPVPGVKLKRVKLTDVEQDSGSLMSAARARKILSTLATIYTQFKRSGGSKLKGSDWEDLESALIRVRNLKISGKLPID